MWFPFRESSFNVVFFLALFVRFCLLFLLLLLLLFFGLIDWFDAAAVVVVVVLLFLCSFALLVIKPDMEGTVYMYSQKIIN